MCSFWVAQAQEEFLPLSRFDLPQDPLTITKSVNPNEPFTVAGERGAIFGQQDGSCEIWAFPVKILEHLQITARVDDYKVPIRLNAHAAAIEVSPDHTTIVYSHPAITVKQHMFAPRANSNESATAIVIFDIQSVRPAILTFQFEPSLTPQWPAPEFGRPTASWIKIGNGGGYLLETASEQLSGIVAMPRTVAAILPPIQERPEAYPLELTLHYDPEQDKDLIFPLLAMVSYNQSGTPEATAKRLAQGISVLNKQTAEIYAKTHEYYSHFFDDKLTIDSPDSAFNQAFRWAELAIDQSQVLLGSETGLVAGWYSSGASARPGYGWFFGRDALWSIFAIDAYGDFALTRNALEFLIRRQRQDGKIMHEYSQTAGLVDWEKTPYWYAAADSTPLFVMAMADYLRTSGDVDFVRRHWDSVKLAYEFTRMHDADHDGVYDNSTGTGWVESWKPRMPDQEIYLAALDQQSSEAMADLAKVIKDEGLNARALAQATVIRERLNDYRQPDGFYAFSKNVDGSFDSTATIFPSVAWWTGHLVLPNADSMLTRWASHEFSSDWGLRSLSDQSPLFDPLSYHQGTVWPLFTGWVALAEYRAGHPLSGYQQLMSSLNLTWAHDPGGITELLSGKFNAPLGRSSSRQTWSSAMIISVILRGMFGLETDVSNHFLRVTPALPSTWDWVDLRHVPFGNGQIDLSLRRFRGELRITSASGKDQLWCLSTSIWASGKCNQTDASKQVTTLQLEPVEVEFEIRIPAAGSQTQQMKVLQERYSKNQLVLELEAPGGSQCTAFLRINKAGKRNLQVTGGNLTGSRLHIAFPPGAGYQKQEVLIRW